MSACPAFTADGGIADALRSVDCMSAAGTAEAFGRLLGSHGMLGPVLTLVMTLYVALLAINLLTGRSSLGLSMLTPRMLGLGLVLTFATSWIAYQSVVWNLLVGGPDWIAGVLVGTKGSATSVFASRLDIIFDAVARAAEAAQNGGGGDGATGTPIAVVSSGKMISPADLLWFAALLLMLGTVGVLLVARIALAALLALGPVFILMGLFRGTRGLFEGWLKAAVLFALVPLLTVLIGGAGLVMMAPLIRSLDGGQPDMRAAATVFMGACVHVALMIMALRTATTLTAGWRLPGSVGRSEERSSPAWRAAPVTVVGAAQAIAPREMAPVSADRVRAIVGGLAAHSGEARGAGTVSDGDRGSHDRARTIVALSGRPLEPPTPADDARARGIGSRYRAPISQAKELPA